MNINSLLKSNRLLSKSDFQNLRSGSRFLISNIALAYTKKNEKNHGRLGIAASRKFGNSVQRNKFKRKVREYFRQSELKNFPIDLLITPNLKIIKKEKLSYNEIWKKLDQSLEELFSSNSL